MNSWQIITKEYWKETCANKGYINLNSEGLDSMHLPDPYLFECLINVSGNKIIGTNAKHLY